MKKQEGATLPNEKRKLSESLCGASDQPEKSRKINPQEMMENDMKPTGKNTLVAKNLHLPKPKTNYFKRAISYKGVECWNELPLHIKLSENLSVFKKLCKEFYMLH